MRTEEANITNKQTQKEKKRTFIDSYLDILMAAQKAQAQAQEENGAHTHTKSEH